MTYNRSWRPGPSSSHSTKGQLVLPVGRRAFLHLPATGAETGDFTPFGRKPGATPDEALVDGQEVEIIAWRPSGPEGPSYQIQRLSDHREWWARAACLRVSAIAVRAAE